PARHSRKMTGRGVVRVARLEGLLVVGVAERDGARDHVSPVRALAAVVREPPEERRSVGVGEIRLESDRIAVELTVTTDEDRALLHLRRGLLGHLRHLRLLYILSGHHVQIRRRNLAPSG